MEVSKVTGKLYYQDAYLTNFSADIVKRAKDERGRDFIVLTQTAFFPTGGGQPHDNGWINDQKVIEVEETVGEVRHYLEKPLPKNATQITGEIDWARRFDHMQQHAGQHILSAAFDNLFQYKTVSFHLGQETLTIDIDTDSLTAEEANKAEDMANQIILENRTIHTEWITEEELDHYPLRKETKVKDHIRLVIIPDYDYNGCGGTHPKTTGEVRAIKILNWERQKKKVRVQFLCGDRVLKQFGQKHKILQELTRLLNAPEAEMPAAVSKLLDSNKEEEKLLEQTRDLLLEYEAKELLSQREPFLNTEELIANVFQNRSIQELQKLARLIISENQQVNVFFVAENEDRLQVVLARGAAGIVQMKNLLVEVLGLIDGKGGGNDSFAQGGGTASVTGNELLALILKKFVEE